ncbi:MAG: hypothetical protein ACRDRH_06190 [Pseudonocardia sp.]
MRRIHGGFVGLALAAVLLAGCGGAPGAPAPVPPPPAPAAPTSVPAAPADPDATACLRHAATVDVVRTEIRAYEAGPVAVIRPALVLLAARQAYVVLGVQDRERALAVAEAINAIDDLDVQGKALVPPGGSELDLVQLDPTRIRAAMDALDRICAGG